jgi:hypothetical protein
MDQSLPPTPAYQPPTAFGQQPSGTTVVSSGQPKSNKKKIIGAGVGILLLVVGLISGLFLVNQQQLFQQKAWDCSKYHFVLTQTGQVSAVNDSNRVEPLQKADVYINNQKVTTLDVPQLAVGQSAIVGQVTVPTSGAFNWQVKGVSDCSSAGSFQAQETAKCLNIKAYDKDWNVLTQTDLSALKAGSKVRFAVTGSTSTGAFSKARFTINGVKGPEVTTKRPSSDDYYYEYTVPTGTTTFTINAELYHSQFNDWF